MTRRKESIPGIKELKKCQVRVGKERVGSPCPDADSPRFKGC